MSGSQLSLIVMPIVFALSLIIWISGIFYANAHPHRGRYSTALPTEVRGGSFQAMAGGRQLMPIPEHPVEHGPAGEIEEQEAPPAEQAEPARAAPLSAAEAIHRSQPALVDEPPPAPVLIEAPPAAARAPGAVVPPARRPAAAPAGRRIPGQRPGGAEPSARQVAQDARQVAGDSVRLLTGRIASALRSRRH